MSTGSYPGPRPDRVTAQRMREAALARLTRARGIAVIAAGTLTAVVVGVVSAASGRTLGAHPAVRASVAAAPVKYGSAKLPRLAGARQLGLGAPGSPPEAAPAPQSAPAPAPQQPQVQPQSAPAPAVSGGS